MSTAFWNAPAERPAFRRTGKSRHFFAALAVLYAAVAVAGFLPIPSGCC